MEEEDLSTTFCNQMCRNTKTKCFVCTEGKKTDHEILKRVAHLLQKVR